MSTTASRGSAAAPVGQPLKAKQTGLAKTALWLRVLLYEKEAIRQRWADLSGAWDRFVVTRGVKAEVSEEWEAAERARLNSVEKQLNTDKSAYTERLVDLQSRIRQAARPEA